MALRPLLEKIKSNLTLTHLLNYKKFTAVINVQFMLEIQTEKKSFVVMAKYPLVLHLTKSASEYQMMRARLSAAERG